MKVKVVKWKKWNYVLADHQQLGIVILILIFFAKCWLGVVSLMNSLFLFRFHHSDFFTIIIISFWFKSTGRQQPSLFSSRNHLSWCVLLGHGQGTGDKESKGDGGAEHGEGVRCCQSCQRNLLQLPIHNCWPTYIGTTGRNSRDERLKIGFASCVNRAIYGYQCIRPPSTLLKTQHCSTLDQNSLTMIIVQCA